MDSEVGSSRLSDAKEGKLVSALEFCQIVEVPAALRKLPECAALEGQWFRRINEALTCICTTCARAEVAPDKRKSIKQKVRADWGNCYWDGASAGDGERMSRYRQLVSSTNALVPKRVGCITNPKACRVGTAWHEPGSSIRQACLEQCRASERMARE